MFAAVGWTTFTDGSCRGGFVIQHCIDMAESIAELINSDDAQCSYLGTRASKRFQAGLYRLRSNEYMINRWGVANELGYGALGGSIPPLSRKVHLNETLWGYYSGWLTRTIVHEEGHMKYWLKEMFSSPPSHEHGDKRDLAMEVGERCAPIPQ